MTTTALSPGDRVRERGRPGMDVVTPASSAFKKVSSYRHASRRGLVIELQTKPDSAGRRTTYASVLWDGRTSPSLHSITRLQRLQEE